MSPVIAAVQLASSAQPQNPPAVHTGVFGVPVAFAIGLAFLIAPSGWLLRLLSPWATGFEAPPPWPTTQDPWGLGLIAVLVATLNGVSALGTSDFTLV